MSIRALPAALVAAVTAYLVALVFAGAAGGASIAELTVYAVTAAFGLEYLIATWPQLWPRRRGGRA